MDTLFIKIWLYPIIAQWMLKKEGKYIWLLWPAEVVVTESKPESSCALAMKIWLAALHSKCLLQFRP